MNAIYRIKVYLLIAVLFIGCSAFQEEWTSRAAQSFLAPEDELATVVAVYDYIERMRGLPSAARVQEYRDLEHNLTEETSIGDRLKLALFFSGLLEPELVNYERARKLLEDSLAQARGALLTGHIQFMLIALSYNERQHEQLQGLQQQLAAQQRENQALQAKTKTLEEKIQTFEAKILALEAKIEALTSIEQSIKERGQVE